MARKIFKQTSRSLHLRLSPYDRKISAHLVLRPVHCGDFCAVINFFAGCYILWPYKSSNSTFYISGAIQNQRYRVYNMITWVPTNVTATIQHAYTWFSMWYTSRTQEHILTNYPDFTRTLHLQWTFKHLRHLMNSSLVSFGINSYHRFGTDSYLHLHGLNRECKWTSSRCR